MPIIERPANLECYSGSGRPGSNEFTTWNLCKHASERSPSISSFIFCAP